MPDEPISGLPEALPLDNADLFAVEQAGVTVKSPVQQVKTAFDAVEVVKTAAIGPGNPIWYQDPTGYTFPSGDAVFSSPVNFHLPRPGQGLVIIDMNLQWLNNDGLAPEGVLLKIGADFSGTVLSDLAAESSPLVPTGEIRWRHVCKIIPVSLPAGIVEVRLFTNWAGRSGDVASDGPIGTNGWTLLAWPYPQIVSTVAFSAAAIVERITESGSVRITESGSVRILE